MNSATAMKVASVKVPSEYILERLDPSEHNLRIRHIDKRNAPFYGCVPAVTVEVFTRQHGSLMVELRSSDSCHNNIPDDIDRHLEYELSEGYNCIEIEFDFDYSTPRHAFICLGCNPDLKTNSFTI